MEAKMINGMYCAEMGCCGIFAAALVSGQEPQFVFDAYKAKRKKTGNWKGSTTEEGLQQLLAEDLEVEYEIMPITGMLMTEFYSQKCDLNSTYVVWTRDHAMVVDKGRLIDQWQCAPIASAKMKKSWVCGAIKILSPTSIPDGDVSGGVTEEQIIARRSQEQKVKLEKSAHALPRACAKYSLDQHKIVEHAGDKLKIAGYNPNKKRHPFILEIIEQQGKPCARYGLCDARTAQSLFGLQNQQQCAA